MKPACDSRTTTATVPGFDHDGPVAVALRLLGLERALVVLTTSDTTTPTSDTTMPTLETVDTTIPPEVGAETASTPPEEDQDDPETDDETEETLPFTGLGTGGMAGAAAVALAAGAGLAYLTRRNPEHLSR